MYMAKETQQKIEFEKNLGSFNARDGRTFKSHYVDDKYAKSIMSIFKDVYEWNYLYPYVYDIEALKKEINKSNQYWAMISPSNSNEVVALAVIKKLNEFSLYVGKVNIKRKYQGIGLGAGLGSTSFTTIIGNPNFKDIRRLDSDVRAVNLNSQKFIERTGSKPYGFIPNYNNYEPGLMLIHFLISDLYFHRLRQLLLLIHQSLFHTIFQQVLLFEKLKNEIQKQEERN